MINDRINKKRMKLIGALFDKLCHFENLSATSSHVVDVGVVFFLLLLFLLNELYVRTYARSLTRALIISAYVRTHDNFALNWTELLAEVILPFLRTYVSTIFFVNLISHKKPFARTNEISILNTFETSTFRRTYVRA